jgi:hypothetical protein
VFFIDLTHAGSYQKPCEGVASWVRAVVDRGHLSFVEWDVLGLDCFGGKVSMRGW